MMPRQKNWQAAVLAAAAIVESYRAKAPVGFDPQNMADTIQFDMCAEATSFGIAEAGRISGEIIKRQIDIPSPFRDRIEKSQWNLGVGFSNTYRTYNPVVFEAESDTEMTPWNAGVNGTNDGVGADGYPLTAACNPPLQEVPLLGIQDRTFGLSVKGYKTPMFCAFDLSTKQAADELLRAYYDTLSKNSNYFVERQIQNAYTLASRHKIIANGAYNTNAIDGAYNTFDANGNSIFPAVAPASLLTQAMLDNIKVQLGFTVTSAPNMTMSAGRVIYDLFTDDLTSSNLVMQNQGIRTDYQFAYMGAKQGAPTIGGVGAYQGKEVNGYRHLYIKFPARWDLVAGQWIRIRPYDPIISQTQLAQGPQSVTQEYLNAPFQDSYIFMTTVVDMVVQKPVPRIGPAVFGTPIKDYAGGDWMWFGKAGVQGCNLEGTNGFWWTVFRFGFKQIDPQVGYVIRHRRCGIPDSVYNCGSGFTYGTTTDYGYGIAG
jgi:hypothetical protein